MEPLGRFFSGLYKALQSFEGLRLGSWQMSQLTESPLPRGSIVVPFWDGLIGA